MVDVDLADGTRLKAMVAPDDRVRAGMKVEPSFSSFFVFRDNELVHDAELQIMPQSLGECLKSKT
jgi:putative spermidine/putrescine transport system ATP-binding protein